MSSLLVSSPAWRANRAPPLGPAGAPGSGTLVMMPSVALLLFGCLPLRLRFDLGAATAAAPTPAPAAAAAAATPRAPVGAWPGGTTAPDVTPSVSSWLSMTPRCAGALVGGGASCAAAASPLEAATRGSVGVGVIALSGSTGAAVAAVVGVGASVVDEGGFSLMTGAAAAAAAASFSFDDEVDVSFESGTATLRFSCSPTRVAAAVGRELDALGLAGVSSWPVEPKQGRQAKRDESPPLRFFLRLGGDVREAAAGAERETGAVEDEGAVGLAAVVGEDVGIEVEVELGAVATLAVDDSPVCAEPDPSAADARFEPSTAG